MKEAYRMKRMPEIKDGSANQLKYQTVGPIISRGNVKIAQRMAVTMPTIM